MTFSTSRVAALLVKELAELLRNRAAIVPVLFLALVTVVLPFLITILVPLVAGEPLASDPEFARAARRVGLPHTMPLSDEGAVQTFIFQQFMLLQLLIPVTGAMAFAGYSLIGEKQARTLEPLLATPITTTELLVAKGLGALLPSLGIMLGALVRVHRGHGRAGCARCGVRRDQRAYVAARAGLRAGGRTGRAPGGGAGVVTRERSSDGAAVRRAVDPADHRHLRHAVQRRHQADDAGDRHHGREPC